MKKQTILKTFLLSIIFNVSNLYSEELTVTVNNTTYIVSADSEIIMTQKEAVEYCNNKEMILPNYEILMAIYKELYLNEIGNFCGCHYWSNTKVTNNKYKSMDFSGYRGGLTWEEDIKYSNRVICVAIKYN